MPNTMAYATLAFWPVVTFLMFLYLPKKRATIASVLGAMLLLPVRAKFDFPGVPPLDKTSIANLSLLICAVSTLGRGCVRLPKSNFLRFALIAYVASPFFTALTNSDPIILSSRAIAGMTLYDAVSTCAGQVLTVIPFIIGYNVLGDEPGHQQLVRALAVAGLVYSVPMLIEIRLSPQFHNWVYGYFPHSFVQQMRGSGFRPVVFLGHGLLVAIFCAMAVLATGLLARQKQAIRGLPATGLFLYLFVVLVLCKSMGAFMLAVASIPVLLWARPRRIAAVSGIVAFILLLYPLVRGTQFVPTGTAVSFARQFSTDRADSLEFRLVNEDKLLAKTNERPLFGWGTWGRNRVYDGYDDSDTSVTDGSWIIVVSSFGWVGYLASFGLLCYPLCARLAKSRRFGAASLTTVGLGLVLMINLIDLIPNSSLFPLTWLIAGALSVPVRPQAPAVRERAEAVAAA